MKNHTILYVLGMVLFGLSISGCASMVRMPRISEEEQLAESAQREKYWRAEDKRLFDPIYKDWPSLKDAHAGDVIEIYDENGKKIGTAIAR